MRFAASGIAIVVAPFLPGWTLAAPVETVIHGFASRGDGARPCTGLIADAQGALYGATLSGGANGAGAVLRLTPPAGGETAWTETILYSFKGAAAGDGAGPIGRLIFDRQGALLGVTQAGGIDGAGAVFRLSPPAGDQTAWTETVLYRFKGPRDGANPSAGLVADEDGALYGTTLFGGAAGKNGHGTVFKLTPPAEGQKAWTETTIYRFKSGSDGANPYAALIADKDGALYGTTLSGGTVGRIGYGTVFRLTPPAPGEKDWTEAVLHRFAGAPGDGDSPQAGLVAGPDGALYGTTFLGGSSGNHGAGFGTVFRVTPPAGGQTAWTETVLYRFCAQAGCGDGSIPMAELIADEDGALYGATAFGGRDCAFYSDSGCGTVFRLAPPAGGETDWTETTLHRFAGGADGATPSAALAVGRDGALYGATPYGGSDGDDAGGALFRLTLCPEPGLSGLRAKDRDQDGCPALVSALAPVPAGTPPPARESHIVDGPTGADRLRTDQVRDLSGAVAERGNRHPGVVTLARNRRFLIGFGRTPGSLRY